MYLLVLKPKSTVLIGWLGCDQHVVSLCRQSEAVHIKGRLVSLLHPCYCSLTKVSQRSKRLPMNHGELPMKCADLSLFYRSGHMKEVTS